MMCPDDNSSSKLRATSLKSIPVRSTNWFKLAGCQLKLLKGSALFGRDRLFPNSKSEAGLKLVHQARPKYRSHHRAACNLQPKACWCQVKLGCESAWHGKDRLISLRGFFGCEQSSASFHRFDYDNHIRQGGNYPIACRKSPAVWRYVKRSFREQKPSGGHFFPQVSI